MNVRLLTQMTVHDEKYVEQGEHLSIADKSEKFDTCFENQYNCYSESWELINL